MKIPFHDILVQNRRSNEPEKASAGVFGVIIYTGAHTNTSLLTFLLSLLFYEFGPGGLRIPQKIWGLGLGLGDLLSGIITFELLLS